MEKNDLQKSAREAYGLFQQMLENAPQEMSNVTLIKDALTAADKLITFLENDDEPIGED